MEAAWGRHLPVLLPGMTSMWELLRDSKFAGQIFFKDFRNLSARNRKPSVCCQVIDGKPSDDQALAGGRYPKALEGPKLSGPVV